jgi:5-methylcytosine-specific restriction endonuclease McrA
VTKPRGTSNTNARGSSTARRRRKQFLLDKYGDGTTTTCYRCPAALNFETITVDRIIPGCEGGTYRRDNIRPACAPCNEHTGGKLGASRRARNRLSHQEESS